MLEREKVPFPLDFTERLIPRLGAVAVMVAPGIIAPVVS
jgi:hypothetical protein